MKLATGSTVVPILLSSDKTRLTNLGGNKTAWPVYMSVGNLAMDLRLSPSMGSWIPIAYLPHCEWETELSSTQKDDTFHGICTSRLFHQALKHVLLPLEEAGRVGVPMVDACGNMCHCFPLLAAYLGDYPEQILVNIAPYDASPVTMATRNDTGAAKRFPEHTYGAIMGPLQKLREELKENTAEDTLTYHVKASALGLSAIREPFWEHLPHVQPNKMITPDILHNAHGFFRHHIVQWVFNLVDKADFDLRVSSMPRMVGLRAYPNGLSKFKQWTGRDAREIQRYILGLIQGAPKIKPKVTKAICALLDFIYIAQYQSHSNDTLEYLETALQDFHKNKHIFWDLGARTGKWSGLENFNIPKLCGFHDYEPSIQQFGTIIQFSTDITEFFHKQSTKEPYRSTNKQDFMAQICIILDHREKWVQFRQYLAWVQNRETSPWSSTDSADESDAKICGSKNGAGQRSMPYRCSATQSERVEQAVKSKSHSRHIKGTNAADLKLTKLPHHKYTLHLLTTSYNAPELLEELVQLIQRLKSAPELAPEPLAQAARLLSTTHALIWDRIRVTVPTVQDPSQLTKHQTIPAEPPSHKAPVGQCGTVLLHWSSEAETVGIQGKLFLKLNLCWFIHAFH